MKREFLTVPNLLSLSRIVLLVPLSLVLSLPAPSDKVWGTVIILIAVLTDKLDGEIARRYGQESRWGLILDPVADKIAVAGFAFMLYVRGDLPAWFLLAVVARDVLILAGALILRRKSGETMPSNLAGKVAVTVISATFLLAFLGVPDLVKTVCMLATLLVLIWSLVFYAIRLRQVGAGAKD